MKINVRSDVNKLLRQHANLREQLLRAAAKAINDTAAEVRKAAIEEIASKQDGISKATIRGYITVRKAKYRAHGETKAGVLRKNYGGITATITAAGKAPNLIYFVPPASRTPEAWRQGAGVAAHVVGKTTVYQGSFIVRTKGGKTVVVTRSAMAKANPQAFRPRGGKGKWLPKWSKGLYGPNLKSLAATSSTQDAMRATADEQWPIMWNRASNRVLIAAGVQS